VDFSLVFANGAIFGRILHRKRKWAFCGIFRERLTGWRGKQSPYRAYFPSGHCPLISLSIPVRANKISLIFPEVERIQLLYPGTIRQYNRK
jgi:hypothetical protein